MISFLKLYYNLKIFSLRMRRVRTYISQLIDNDDIVQKVATFVGELATAIRK